MAKYVINLEETVVTRVRVVARSKKAALEKAYKGQFEVMYDDQNRIMQDVIERTYPTEEDIEGVEKNART